MTKHTNAVQAGQVTPMRYADHASAVIAGAAMASAYLERIRGGEAPAGELAKLLSQVHGHTFEGACRALEKALEVSCRA